MNTAIAFGGSLVGMLFLFWLIGPRKRVAPHTCRHGHDLKMVGVDLRPDETGAMIYHDCEFHCRRCGAVL